MLIKIMVSREYL